MGQGQDSVDPLRCSAIELAAQIRARTISSEELTRFFLARIDAHNSELSAFVTVHRTRALRRARACDRAVASGTPGLPLFWGVPSAIKDLVPTRGDRTALGSRAWRYFVSPFDAPAAKMIKRAGFVLLGKLATSEFGAMPVTEPDIHPPTRNPWNPERSAGGSSGGSAAAMAAGLLPLAHGSDGGGSIRIPSAFCHLFGFKPSLSFIGNLHGRVNGSGLSVMGPLAHHVEDAAGMLDVLRGQIGSRGAAGTCLHACQQRPERLRVRVSLESPLGDAVEPVIAQAVRRKAKRLESLGHSIEEVSMERGTAEEFLPIWQHQLSQVPSPSEAVLQPFTRWLRREGKKHTLESVMAMKRQIEQRVHRAWGDADILLTPTVPTFAPPIGKFSGMSPEAIYHGIAPYAAFTAVFNATRQPAITLPAGLSEDGLPFGVQMVGRQGEDKMLFSLAKQCEEDEPWQGRRPARYY